MASAALPETRRAFQTIDLCRFLAASAVVWNHAWNLVATPEKGGDGLGWHLVYISAGFGLDAVVVFFVISGFWIGRSVITRVADDRFSWRDYALDRLARLWTVLLPALLLGGLLDAISFRVLHSPLSQVIAERLDARHFFASLFFLQEITMPSFGSNGPLWSLAYEAWYYVWFPVAALLIFKRRVAPTTLLMIAVSVILAHRILVLLPAWLLGVCAYAVVSNQGSADHADKRWLSLTAALFGSTLIGSHLLDTSYLIRGVSVGGTFAILLVTIVRGNHGILPTLAPLAHYGAKSSFSLYVVHMPILVLLSALLWPKLPASRIGALGSAITLATCALALAYLFSRVTEYHTGTVRRLLGRLLQRLGPESRRGQRGQS